MLNFTLDIPTRIIFGKDALSNVGKEVKKLGHKVMLHHDSGDYLSNILVKVKGILEEAGVSYVDFGGVKPNPRMSLMEEGIAICRREGIDCVLAIGGGSVMDSAKVIALCTVNKGDITEYTSFKRLSDDCLPLGAIVTTPGTGSEVSNNAMAVDDRSEPWIKYPLFQSSFRFKFALMDPQLTYTLPPRQTASGAMDIISHTMERYFNGPNRGDIQNRLSEANMLTTMDAVKKALKDPENYEARANLLFTSMLAQNTLLDVGVDSDWAVHGIENPITTTFGLTHGTCLAIMTPAWMKYVYKRDLSKFAEFAVRVMGVDADFYDLEGTALCGIERLEDFIKRIGLPTTLEEVGVGPECFEKFADIATRAGVTGAVSKLTKADVIRIYELAQ